MFQEVEPTAHAAAYGGRTDGEQGQRAMSQAQRAVIALLVCLVGWIAYYDRTSSQRPVLPPSEQLTGAASSRENPAEKLNWTNWTHDPVAVFTAALTIFNGLLFVSSLGLWLATRRSAQISERALTELEAPFVFVQINVPGLNVQGAGVSWGNLQWCVVNFGRTPASILEIFVDVRLVPFGEDPEPVNPAARRGDRLPFGVIAPPNGGQSHDFPIVPTNAALQQSGPPGRPFTTHSPFFLGFVRYADIFRNHFVLGFCFIFDAQTNRWIRALGDEYNYSHRET